MLLLNSFIAIASNIIPNTFFKIAIPTSPSALSKVVVKRKTIHTTNKFKTIATRMLIN